jgi:hypothetical protein
LTDAGLRPRRIDVGIWRCIISERPNNASKAAGFKSGSQEKIRVANFKSSLKELRVKKISSCARRKREKSRLTSNV